MPLLSQSCWVPSVAWKNRVPFTFVRYFGYEPPMPGLMSATICVPAAVPLLSHSSVPWLPSLALKNEVPFTFVR